jgi:hypothetical protein
MDLGRALVVSFAAAIPPSTACAQEATAPIESGPQVGAVLPVCAVFAPSGPFAGEGFDVAARVGKLPAAILFVHELNRNTGPMVSGLDRLGVLFAWTGLQVHMVRIAGDRTAAEIQSQRSSEAMGLHRPLLVSVDGAEGPGAYALHRKATLTLVLAKDGKVVRSAAFTDTGRADLGKLRALVEEVTGPLPKDEKELRSLMTARLTHDAALLRAMVIELAVLAQKQERAEQNRAQRQSPSPREPPPPSAEVLPARPREGKAPDDEQLRALLRRCIQHAADDRELTAVFREVQTRIGDDAQLRAQAVEMFRLMLSLDYGNEEAQKRARAFVDEHRQR